MGLIKRILGTKKVGHTGTLDSFADGLLVVVAGHMTRFAELITSEKKTYEVWAEFGQQTDTLDPTGVPVKTGDSPSIKGLKAACQKFIGKIEQTPPEFSAIKINGKRASDRIRSGETINLKPRQIEIFSINLDNIICDKNNNVKYALLKVDCSKGTYIRSLIRDIAETANSCGFVQALRRTAVGQFKLEDAVGFSCLPNFLDFHCTNKDDTKICKHKVIKNEALLDINLFDDYIKSELETKCLRFIPKTATLLGLNKIFIKSKYLIDFKNGKNIKTHWFLQGNELLQILPACEKIAVFSYIENTQYSIASSKCIGLISIRCINGNNFFSYEAVLNN